MRKILVIDDDTELQNLLKKYLEREGFKVLPETSASGGLASFERNQPDLIVLDIFLSHANGLDTCRQLRERTQKPIILISAKGDESDKVLGLGLGADDFLTKPFSMNELVARIKAQIRRQEYYEAVASEKKEGEEILAAGPLVINIAARTLTCRGKPVTLTAKEFDLLAYFVRHEGWVLSKDVLYESIWGLNSTGDSRTVMVHVRHLREKLELDPEHPEMFVTVWGVGYKFSSKGKY